MKIFPRQIPARHFKFLCAITLLLVGLTSALRAQSALDGFDPNVVSGTTGTAVIAVAVQSDGKILIGGDFNNTVAGQIRNRIARLNPDGTLDTAFNPNADGTVRSIVIQADGKILVAGTFTNIGGQTRNRIARLDGMTGLADSFDPNANSGVTTLAVQSDGKILVGGYFSSVGGQTRNNIARLDATSGLADSFNPNASSNVNAIVVQRDGKILVGGIFSTIGGQMRNDIARLDATTGFADSFDPSANGGVTAIAQQADGKILLGGSFTNVGGQARNFIARVDAATGLTDSFNPNPGSGFINGIYSIAIQADGKILAGGTFANIGGQSRSHIARLDSTTGQADSFDPSAHGSAFMDFVNIIVVQADGKILVGGQFTTLAPNGGTAVTRNRIARLEIDGNLDRTLNPGVSGGSFVFATAVQPDGKILIGGLFTNVLGVTRNRIARLNTDGTLDTAFNPNANDRVYSIAVQADGKILAGGEFTNIGGQPRNLIARLDATTGLADSFNPNASGSGVAFPSVSAISVQADGKIILGGAFTTMGGQQRNHLARLDGMTGLADSFNPNPGGISFPSVSTILVQADGGILVGGGFTTIGGQTRPYIARLNGTTGLADSFNPSANSTVFAIAVQADGKILAGGSFVTIGGQPRTRIARLDATTGLADSFNPNANDVLRAIAPQADGKILAVGHFTSIGGQTRNRIARLEPITGLADPFDPNANTSVYSIAVQPDGKVLAGGEFASIGGQTRSLFARLTNDTAALQDLAVTQTTVTWIRGGSSPTFARVTFESSIDNVNYNFLGHGTAAGSNWILTGLNLSTGQNIYIRARGHCRSGLYNGSESITESVRNAFLLPLPVPSQVVSRKLHNGAPFDINLPLAGGGIECRSGGATNDYQVVFTFPDAVTFNSASVSSGSGTVTSSSGNGTTAITVNLTGVTNAQRITVTLVGVNNAGDVSVPMGVLVGDTNGDGVVNSGDSLQTRNRSGQTTDGTNFRSDVNTDGFVNSGDTLSVRNRSGTFLP